jgi:hypothetical protein
MLKQLAIEFIVEKGDKKYTFTMPHGAPFGEAYDACFEVLREVVEMSKVAADQAKREEGAEEKVEVVE